MINNLEIENLNFKKSLSYMFECFTCMYVRVPCVCLVLQGTEKGVRSLRTGYRWLVVNCHVDSGNRTQVLWKRTSARNH